MSDAERPDPRMLRVADLLGEVRVVRPERAPAHPRVSVVVDAGGGPVEELEKTLGDLLGQTFTDLEIVVVDDGPSEELSRSLESLQVRDDRLVRIQHDRSLGLPAVRFNEGIEAARGRWIAFLSPGARWEPTALDSLLAAGERAGGPCLVVARTRGGEGEPGPSGSPPLPVSALTLTFRNTVGRTGALVERSLLERHGVFDGHISLARLFDWDLWLRLAQRAPLAVLEECVGREPQGAGARSDPARWTPAARFGFRVVAAIPRDHELTLQRWRDRRPLATEFDGYPLPAGYRRELEGTIDGWLRQHGHADPRPELRTPRDGENGTEQRRTTTLLLAGDSYHPALDLCFPPHPSTSPESPALLPCYEPVVQATGESVRWSDGVVLVRTVTEPGFRLLESAQAEGRPVAYYLDDDLLNLHLLGPPWDGMGPGTDRDQEIRRQIAAADAVWSTSPRITEVVAALNPRVVPHGGAIDESYLPAALRPRARRGVLRIGAFGSGYQNLEFSMIWPALQELAGRFGRTFELELWGIDVAALPPLGIPVKTRPYRFGYRGFLEDLAAAEFDVLLCPLLDEPAPRRAKAPSKYFHAAVAGALGIFSDVAPFEELPGGRTCLKAANSPDAWLAAMAEARSMPDERFDGMRTAMLADVKLNYTVSARADLHLAAWLATEFHARSRPRRGVDGRPSIVYFGCGSSEGDEELLDAATVAEGYGIRPLLVGDERRGLPSRAARFGYPRWLRDGEGMQALEALLASEPVSLVHTTRSIAELESVCRRFAVPLVAGVGAEARLSLPAHGARELFRRYVGALAATAETKRGDGDVAGRGSAEQPGPAADRLVAPATAPEGGAAGTLRDRVSHELHRAGLLKPLVKARWALRRKRVLVLFDTDVVSIDLYFRSVRGPLERATGREWILRNAAEVGPYDLHTACAVFFPRALSRRCVDLMAAARRAGCLTIYDTDDNLLLIDQPIATPATPGGGCSARPGPRSRRSSGGPTSSRSTRRPPYRSSSG
ncbi:MAG: glycosyltransferase family 2 protein [Holophagales bacterium]|nr:glycosyltransferase family 2 protein [Holophagales bacterium]